MARTRDIRTNQNDVSCDVCGRTLLRGERAEPYLAGGARRQVCELCTGRAQHEGWIREHGADELQLRSARQERPRTSWLERLRARRERARELAEQQALEATEAEEPRRTVRRIESTPAEPATPPPEPAPPPRQPRHVRAVTGGQGEYTLEFLRYEEIPAHLAQKVAEKAREEAEAVA